MKDSGIEWIGDIPKSWMLPKLKYVANIFCGSFVIKTLQDDSYLYPVFNGGTGNTGRYKNYNCDGDLVLMSSRGANAGYVYMYQGKCWIGNSCYALKNFSSASYQYLFYALKLSEVKFQIDRTTTTIPAISQDQVDNLYIALPDLHNQKVIATYLEKKCSEIDSVSENIQRQIEILEDYKKSVISEAVTKGLNPGVEMKDSGIEWIGMIPRHWKIHPVYNYFYDGNTSNYRMQEQNLLSLSYGRIVRKDINTNGGLLPASFNTYNIVESGDIIIRPTDLQNDKRSLRTGLVKERGIITSAYLDLKPFKNINSKYYHYLLHSYDIMKVFYNMGNGVRQGLNYSEFCKILLLEPPSEEQNLIIDFLEQKTTEIDSLISDKQKQLEILADYKKSLIYEYVTGKKEVLEQA